MKRIFSAFLLCAVLLSCCVGAFAGTGNEVQSSNILKTYSATASTGDNSGEMNIKYSVTATQVSNSVGVSTIKIYKADGSYVTTISGSTNNGLLARNAKSKNGTYVYKGTSGVSYYAIVYFAATANAETDVKNVTTNTAKAK